MPIYYINIYERIIYSVALLVATYIRGTDERTRNMRRNIVRYCVLSQVLVFRDISMKVRKRFPTLDTVIAAGNICLNSYQVFFKIIS